MATNSGDETTASVPGAAPPAADGRAVHYGYHDLEEDGLAETITLFLADLEGRPPTEVVPDVTEYVDPDALDRLFRPRPDGTFRGPGELELHVAGYEVTVTSEGDIVVRE